MVKSTWAAAVAAFLFALAAAGQTAGAADNACLEGPIAEFGRYVGDWRIEDKSLAKDGSSWEPAAGARWVFECVGDGLAVQDHWMPNDGGYGTNLRTYNPDSGRWEIVWTATTLNGFMHISAEQNDAGDMVMDILSPEQPQPRRIIFHAPDGDGWDWVMEWSFDDGTTWTPVYRIRATPWTGQSDGDT